MLDKLLGIESRFEQLEESFSVPEVTGNAERFREMMKEHKRLKESFLFWNLWLPCCAVRAIV